MITINEKEELKRKIKESIRLLDLYDANHISNGVEIMQNKEELMKKYNQLLLKIDSNQPIRESVTFISKENRNIPFCSSEESYVDINENTKSSVSQDKTKINIDNGMHNYLIKGDKYGHIDEAELERLLVLIKLHNPNINVTLQSFWTSDSFRFPNLTKSREYVLDRCYIISTSEYLLEQDMQSIGFLPYIQTKKGEIKTLNYATIKGIFSRELTKEEYNYTAGLADTKLTQEYIKNVFVNNLRQANPNIEISLFSKGDHFYIKCNPSESLNRPFDSGMDNQVCMLPDRTREGYEIFAKSQTVIQKQCNEELEIVTSQPYRNSNLIRENNHVQNQNIGQGSLNSSANNLVNGIDDMDPTIKSNKKNDQNVQLKNDDIDELIKRIETRILELTEKEKSNDGYGSTLYQRLNNRQDALFAQNQRQMELINQMQSQIDAMKKNIERQDRHIFMLQQQLFLQQPQPVLNTDNMGKQI